MLDTDLTSAGRILRGTVASVDAVSLTCTATIPALDGGQIRQGPCRYQPRSGRHPARGDPCCVAEDETGGLWLAEWVSSSAIPQPPDPAESVGDLRHDQSVPAAVWVIAWPADRVVPPRVTTVIDGSEVYADVEYDEPQRRSIVTFDAPCTGVAYLT